MINSKLSFLAVGVLAASFMFTAGCSNDRITASKLRRDMTPELAHSARSKEQVKNDNARIIDNNTRAAWHDLHRLLLLDRNSRLHPYSTP